jgi:hypothetical protein
VTPSKLLRFRPACLSSIPIELLPPAKKSLDEQLPIPHRIRISTDQGSQWHTFAQLFTILTAPARPLAVRMIQQRIGDLLEIEEGGKHYYVIVLTKIVMFGGNILFAFHNDGKKRDVKSLSQSDTGFNICADLLWPKREGRVTRLHLYEEVSPFWRSKSCRACSRMPDEG